MAAASAGRHKAEAKKWKDRAVADTETGVADDIQTAKAALSQAKLHEARAREAKQRTEDKLDKINAKNPTMADITSSWRKPRGVRDSTDA